jgi:hypothetical protein
MLHRPHVSAQALMLLVALLFVVLATAGCGGKGY